MKFEHIKPEVLAEVEVILPRNRIQISNSDARRLWFFLRMVFLFEQPSVAIDPQVVGMVQRALFILHRDRNSRCRIDPFVGALKRADISLTYRKAMELIADYKTSGIHLPVN